MGVPCTSDRAATMRKKKQRGGGLDLTNSRGSCLQRPSSAPAFDSIELSRQFFEQQHSSMAANCLRPRSRKAGGRVESDGCFDKAGGRSERPVMVMVCNESCSEASLPSNKTYKGDAASMASSISASPHTYAVVRRRSDSPSSSLAACSLVSSMPPEPPLPYPGGGHAAAAVASSMQATLESLHQHQLSMLQPGERPSSRRHDSSSHAGPGGGVVGIEALDLRVDRIYDVDRAPSKCSIQRAQTLGLGHRVPSLISKTSRWEEERSAPHLGPGCYEGVPRALHFLDKGRRTDRSLMFAQDHNQQHPRQHQQEQHGEDKDDEQEEEAGRSLSSKPLSSHRHQLQGGRGSGGSSLSLLLPSSSSSTVTTWSPRAAMSSSSSSSPVLEEEALLHHGESKGAGTTHHERGRRLNNSSSSGASNSAAGGVGVGGERRPRTAPPAAAGGRTSSRVLFSRGGPRFVPERLTESQRELCSRGPWTDVVELWDRPMYLNKDLPARPPVATGFRYPTPFLEVGVLHKATIRTSVLTSPLKYSAAFALPTKRPQPRTHYHDGQQQQQQQQQQGGGVATDGSGWSSSAAKNSRNARTTTTPEAGVPSSSIGRAPPQHNKRGGHHTTSNSSSNSDSRGSAMRKRQHHNALGKKSRLSSSLSPLERLRGQRRRLQERQEEWELHKPMPPSAFRETRPFLLARQHQNFKRRDQALEQTRFQNWLTHRRNRYYCHTGRGVEEEEPEVHDHHSLGPPVDTTTTTMNTTTSSITWAPTQEELASPPPPQQQQQQQQGGRHDGW